MRERDVVLALYAQTVPIMLQHYLQHTTALNVETDHGNPSMAGLECAEFAKQFVEAFINQCCDPYYAFMTIDEENQ